MRKTSVTLKNFFLQKSKAFHHFFLQNSVWSGLGWIGSGRYISDVDFLQKKIVLHLFVQVYVYGKISSSK